MSTTLALWLVFCATAGWVWPWYFVPALAVAPLRARKQLPVPLALTIGGLLFWAVWPHRGAGPLPMLYEWRALVLFGPVALTAAYGAARALLRLSSRSATGDDETQSFVRAAGVAAVATGISDATFRNISRRSGRMNENR